MAHLSWDGMEANYGFSTHLAFTLLDEILQVLFPDVNIK